MTDRSGLPNNAQRPHDIRRELRSHRDLLEAILDFIRHEDKNDVIQAITAIRSSSFREQSHCIVSEPSEEYEQIDQDKKTGT
ncbi:hypothetical protein BJX96DRAFT_157985 [Aspergillus floccosus]